jgi:hypothetical protein
MTITNQVSIDTHMERERERNGQASQLTVGHLSGSNYRISMGDFRLSSFTQGYSLQVSLTEIQESESRQ